MRAGIVTEAEGRHELRDAALKAVRALDEELESWVLVFDNAKEYQLVREWIPSQGGVVLVTSRNPHWDSTISIPVFSPDESVELLKSLLGETAQVEGAAEVAKMLGYHPLALAQAGGWARETNMGLLKYKQLLECSEERRHLLQSAPDSLRHQDYKATIASTVDLAISDLSNPLAADLFDVCTVMSPDKIPYEFLWFFYKNLVHKAEEVATEAEFSAVLKKVCDRSLITAAENHAYDIHRLVQTVRRDTLLADNTASAGKNMLWIAIATAASLFDFDLLQNLDSVRENPSRDYASLVPHCLSLAEFAREFGVEGSEELAVLQINAANYLFEVCRKGERATKLLKEAQRGLTSDVLKLKATVLLARFTYAESIELQNDVLVQLEEALRDFDLQVDVKDHVHEIHGYNTAACYHAYVGRFDEAQSCLTKAESLLNKHTDRSPSLLEASFHEASSIKEDRLGHAEEEAHHVQQMYTIRKHLLGQNSFFSHYMHSEIWLSRCRTRIQHRASKSRMTLCVPWTPTLIQS